MGNLQIANYINENYDNKKLPKINKVVSIAGHYDGYLGEEAGQKAKIKIRKQVNRIFIMMVLSNYYLYGNTIRDKLRS